MLRRFRHRLAVSQLRRAARRSRGAPEQSQLSVGSTGSGKSESELQDLVRMAERGDCAVVLLDGHGPLALKAAGHWAALGHESRMVYEPLDATDRVLCWSMMPRSEAPSPSRRLLEDAETREEVAQAFLAQRSLTSLNDRPFTKEWLDAAIDLCLAQPAEEPLTSLLHAFRGGTAGYERLLTGALRPEIVEKFRVLERLRRRNEVQFETLTGASRRLVELVCGSEVVRLRARPGPFDWLNALRARQLIAFDGGGVRTREVKRSLFLLVSMRVIQSVRLHYAETQSPLPTVLVLEEAGALGLVTPFVLQALAELRKAGMALHLICQSSTDMGDRAAFEALLANVPRQAWHQCLSPADQEVGARALANATFDSLQVHYTRTRSAPDGAEPEHAVSHGRSFDHAGRVLRHDTRSGTLYRARYRHTADPVYKTPQLHEQELRTRLATLRLGDRLVRDRTGVLRERFSLLPAPTGPAAFEAFARKAIARVRSRPIYLPCPEGSARPAPHSLPDAAARLRARAATTEQALPTDVAVLPPR